jgi:hypothetical protein
MIEHHFPVARELAPAGLRSRPKAANSICQAYRVVRFWGRFALSETSVRLTDRYLCGEGIYPRWAAQQPQGSQLKFT